MEVETKFEENQPPIIVDKPPAPIIRHPRSCDGIINAMLGAFSAGVAATVAMFKLFGKK